MKKLTVLLLCLCLLCSLSACSNDTGKDTDPDFNKDTTGTTEPINDDPTIAPTDPTEKPEDQQRYRLLYEHILAPNGTILLAMQYHYNADGILDRVSKSVDSSSTGYTVECDSKGNPVKYVSDSETITFEYNERGQLILRSDGSTATITYTYDDNGNLLSTKYFEVGVVSKTMDHVWEDGVLVKTEVTNYGTKEYILYTYDEEGREIKAETYNDQDKLQYYSETQYEEDEAVCTKIMQTYDTNGTLQEIRIWDYEKAS